MIRRPFVVHLEVSDDLIQSLRFARDDLDQTLIVIVKRGESRESLQCPGHGRKWLSDFVGDGCGQTPESCHAILNRDFVLKALQLRQILKVDYVAAEMVLPGPQRRNRNSEKAHNAVRSAAFNLLAES